MNIAFKNQIIKEIRNPHNKITRFEHDFGEEMTVIAPTKRVLIEVFNSKDEKMLKVGGEQIVVDDKEFEEILLELHICYSSEMPVQDFQERKNVASVGIFRIKKEK